VSATHGVCLSEWCVLLLSLPLSCRTQPYVRGASALRAVVTQETCSKLSGRAGNQIFLPQCGSWALSLLSHLA
jgi:hypothetical protein